MQVQDIEIEVDIRDLELDEEDWDTLTDGLGVSEVFSDDQIDQYIRTTTGHRSLSNYTKEQIARDYIQDNPEFLKEFEGQSSNSKTEFKPQLWWLEGAQIVTDRALIPGCDPENQVSGVLWTNANENELYLTADGHFSVYKIYWHSFIDQLEQQPELAYDVRRANGLKPYEEIRPHHLWTVNPDWPMICERVFIAE